ncbi:hypothetical protein AB1484_38665, partial [Parafrankia sp. FMc6]
LLSAELATYDDRAARERAAERGRLQKKIDELDRRQGNLLRQARDGDPDDPFTQGLRSSYNQLEAERKTALRKIKDLDAADETESDRPGQDSLALLDALPELHLKLRQAPEALQGRLYESTQLTVHLDHEGQEVHMMIKIPVADLDKVAHLAGVTAAAPGPPPAATGHPRRVDAVRTPRGGACAPLVGGPAVDGPGGSVGGRDEQDRKAVREEEVIAAHPVSIFGHVTT